MLKNFEILMLLIRLFLGYMFFSAGINKLTHGEFGHLIGPPWLEEQLAQYGLGLFAQVVAVAQVICGTLLLSQRFGLLGAIMLMPMNVAILAVTTSMQWAGTPFVNAALLVLNSILLALEYRKFRFLLHPDQPCHVKPATTDMIGLNKYSWLGIGFCLLTMLLAFVNITLTNVFALLAFACFAVTLLRSGLLSALDKVLLLLPFMAMAALTLAGMLQSMMVVAALVTVEALLLIFRLSTFNRKNTDVPAPATSTA